MHVIVAPPGEPRTKPRALNVALPLARGAYTVVYDAEDQPDPQQLRRAVSLFRDLPEHVACLQARLAIREPHNWLTRLFAIEYAALFDVINPGLIASGVPLPLGGTSNHFRTAALRDLVGWDAWNVTEDADLGIRLARLGYAVHDLPSSTYEEAPPTLGVWLRQRARWMKGFMQTCITHMRRPATVLAQLGPSGLFGALTMTYGTVISALGYPFFTAAFLVGLWDGSLLQLDTPLHLAWSTTSCVLFGAGLAAMILPAVVGIARRRWWWLLAYVPLLPLYYVLISAAAWRGLGELVFKTYHWNKTEHGLRALKPSRPAPAVA
jgi:cellulose synthase/poly-beta-1,6-N-acetylglucosamine synthase-like glycosyltransferase